MSELSQEPSSLPAPRLDWRATLEKFGPVVALALMILISAIISPSFLKLENIFNLLQQYSFIGIVSLGMTLVIISGGIDLSVGALVALAATLGVWVMNTAINASLLAGESPDSNATLDSPLRIELAKVFVTLHLAGSETRAVFLAIAAMLAVAILAGLFNGVLVAKGRLAPFIATLATMAMFRSLAEWLAQGGDVQSASNSLFEKIGTGGIPWFGKELAPGVPLLIPYPAIAFVVLAIASHIVLNRTRYGRYLFAIGCNERSAVYSAVNVDRVKLITYTLVGFLCGIAGLLISSRLNSVSSSGTGNLYELDAIAAVVVGGTHIQGGSGSIWGTVVGVLILGIIGNMLTLMNVPPYPQGLVKGAIIIVTVLLQMAGRRKA